MTQPISTEELERMLVQPAVAPSVDETPQMTIEIMSDHAQIITVKNGVKTVKSTTLADIQSVLVRDRSQESPLLPGEYGTQKFISSGSRELYAVTTPEHVRVVTFDSRGDGRGIQEYKIPVPSMLWIFIVSVKDTRRSLQHTMAYAIRNPILSERDPMYVFPFSNVNNEYCCWGENHVTISVPKSITTIPDQFLSGHFNSDLDSDKFNAFDWKKNGRDISAFRTSHFFEYLAEQQKLAEANGKNAEFKWDALHPARKTFADAIAQEARRLG